MSLAESASSGSGVDTSASTSASHFGDTAEDDIGAVRFATPIFIILPAAQSRTREGKCSCVAVAVAALPLENYIRLSAQTTQQQHHRHPATTRLTSSISFFRRQRVPFRFVARFHSVNATPPPLPSSHPATHRPLCPSSYARCYLGMFRVLVCGNFPLPRDDDGEAAESQGRNNEMKTLLFLG